MNPKTVLLLSAVTALVFAGLAGFLGYNFGFARGHAAAQIIAQPPPPSPVAIAESATSPSGDPVAAPVVSAIESDPVIAPAKPEAVEEVSSPYRRVKVLVVGTNRGGPDQSTLRFAESNAREIEAILSADYRFHVTSLIGPAATASALRAALVDAVQNLQENEDFIFFFAGHGATLGMKKPIVGLNGPEQKFEYPGLLLPYDAAPNTASDEERLRFGLPNRELVEVLLNTETKGRHRLAIVDACFSGQIVAHTSSADQLDEVDPLAHPTVQIIASGFPSERMIEVEKLGGTAFAAALREVLRKNDGARTRALVEEIVQDLRKEPYVEPQSGKRYSTPSLMTFRQTKGEFHFVQPRYYGEWRRSSSVVTGARSIPAFVLEAQQSGSSPEAEYKHVVAALPPAPPSTPAVSPAVLASAEPAATSPALAPEVIEHYEDRAAGGDATAAAILTEIYGRSANTRDQALAFDYAYAAYGSGQPLGGAALASAFSNGYGVQPDRVLGDALLKQSGLGELLGAVLVGVAAREAFVHSDNSAHKVTAAVVMGTAAIGVLNTLAQNPMTDRFSSDPIRQTRYRLNEMRQDLTKRRPDETGALKQLAELRKTLTAADQLPQSHKDYLLERVAALEAALASSPPDRNAALAIIEEIVPSKKAAAATQATSS